MLLDPDYILYGTGTATLIAARVLMENGQSVLLLNPETDFFIEDCELALDPSPILKNKAPSFEELKFQSLEEVVSLLRPIYPGALESWPSSEQGYFDQKAPYVRGRSRMWIDQNNPNWEDFEHLYLEASQKGLKPQLLNGLRAQSKIPGVELQDSSDSKFSDMKAVVFNRIADLDLVRFRTGLHEFIRERLGHENILHGVQSLSIQDTGDSNKLKTASDTQSKNSQHIQIVFQNQSIQLKPKKACWIFWTPQLSSTVASLMDKCQLIYPKPKGVRVIEDWLLLSRKPIDPSVSFCTQELLMQAHYEGSPVHMKTHRLQVLQKGPLYSLEKGIELKKTSEQETFSETSFRKMNQMIHQLLQWSSFTIRSLTYSQFIEWQTSDRFYNLQTKNFDTKVLTHCDGGLFYIARHLKEFLDEELNEVQK